MQLEQEVIDVLKQKLMVDVNVASQFTQAVIGGTCYYSLAYTRVTKRNSYTVCYKDGEVRRYDLIKYILSVATSQLVAVVDMLSPTVIGCYPRGLGILCSRIVPVKLEPYIY